MKKWFMILLGALMVMTLTACGNTGPNESENSSLAESSQTSSENSSKEENNSADESKNDAMSADNSNAENQAADSENKSDVSSAAVVYFSATGTTKNIAQEISDTLNADIFEILPEKPYSSDDLDYNNDSCRANKEMNDEFARPAIKNDLSAAAEYDNIFIGYPIWWGTAPRIIQTFLDTYNLNGKNVYTFCTSGSSSIEQSISDLKNYYPDINFVSGKRFAAGVQQDEVTQWLDSLQMYSSK